MVIRNQEEQLSNHESALIKYVLIYEGKKKPTDDEKLLYDYCIQFKSIIEGVKNTKEQDESK